MNIRKATFKHIEAELYNYHETKKEIQRLRESIVNFVGEEDHNDTSGKNSVRTITRPTEAIVTRLVDNKTLRNLEEIVGGIESVYVRLEDSQRKIIDKRYWSGRRDNSWDVVAEAVSMSERTVYRHRKYIICAIADTIGWR